MAWLKVALRKNQLHVDLGIRISNVHALKTPNEQMSAVKSILFTAIFEGLDVIGLVDASGPQLGWQARHIANQNNLDIWVVPGEEYICADKEVLLIYNLQESMPPNLDVQSAIKHAKKHNGFVMAARITRRQAQRYNKWQESGNAPHAVEVYNVKAGGYTDNDVQLPKFISSAAQSGQDLSNTNAYTIIKRKELEDMNVLPPNWGVNYVPPFLQDKTNLNNQGVLQ